LHPRLFLSTSLLFLFLVVVFFYKEPIKHTEWEINIRCN
jgi:hypothetical protein